MKKKFAKEKELSEKLENEKMKMRRKRPEKKIEQIKE